MKLILLALAAMAAIHAEDTCFTPAGVDDYKICFSGNSSSTGGWSIVPTEESENPVAGMINDTDVMWVLIAGMLVFFMQAGFSILEAGCVTAKNVQNILYKNLMDACVGAISFWLLGYGFAYGSADDGPFIGTSNFALTDETNGDASGNTYHSFFFQWAFAATAATIVSGSVAERTKLSAYFVYSILITVFVYPVVVHWVWDTEGWLCAWGTNRLLSGDENSNGMIDFAGSGVVHMVGGFSGLMGAIALGPRIGRFEEGGDEKYAPHNVLVAALGVIILWFGWYGFNPGSTLLINGASGIAAKVAVTTTLAAAGAAVTCTIFARLVYKQWDLMLSLNGVLAGLVSITAPCSTVDPWAAFVIGVIGAFVYIGASALLKKLKIDDPLDAFPIHGACGFWGVLSVGLFATDVNVAWAYGNENDAVSTGEQFLVQLIGAGVIAAWTVLTSGTIFFSMKAAGQLRVDKEHELAGLDSSEHGGAAYNDILGLKAPAGAAAEVELASKE